MSTPMELSRTAESCTRTDRVLGMLCVPFATLLLRMRFDRLVALTGRLAAITARPVTVTETSSMVAAVRRAARHHPGRIACLEEAIAVVVLAALRGRTVTWCVGARLMPYTAHAWVEVEGKPVGQPSSPERPYLLLLRAGPPSPTSQRGMR